MINIVQGDILQAEENIIGHQVNCRGVMGAGLAKQIRNKYPNVYERYISISKEQHPHEQLGMCNVVKVGEDKYVANLYAQLNYGRGKYRYTDYEALEIALSKLKYIAEIHKLTVAIPYGIGCGLAGGDWNVVYNIIDKVFRDYDVTLYKLP